jgi:hypothetical protein
MIPQTYPVYLCNGNLTSAGLMSACCLRFIAKTSLAYYIFLSSVFDIKLACQIKTYLPALNQRSQQRHIGGKSFNSKSG